MAILIFKDKAIEGAYQVGSVLGVTSENYMTKLKGRAQEMQFFLNYLNAMGKNTPNPNATTT